MNEETVMTSVGRDIDKYSKDYLNDDFEKTQVVIRRNVVLEILNKYKPRKVLEVGCGLQSLFDFYHDFDSFTIVEPSVIFCDAIKKSPYYDNNKAIHIINDFLEHYQPCDSEKFDFIVASSLLHEVSEPEIFLSCVKNISCRNTIIHFNVPSERSFHLLWALESGLIPKLDILSDTAKDYQRTSTFNMEKLKVMIESNGFTCINSGSYFFKIFNNTKMVLMQKNNLIDKKLLDGLVKVIKYFPENGAEIYVNCKLMTGD
jgi:ubiquinone/menaquinone biosynthesis C-methylase UbiE